MEEGRGMEAEHRGETVIWGSVMGSHVVIIRDEKSQQVGTGQRSNSRLAHSGTKLSRERKKIFMSYDMKENFFDEEQSPLKCVFFFCLV